MCETRKCTNATQPKANIVRTIVLILLVAITLAIVVLLDVVSSVQEVVVVACAIVICSATMVSENLNAAHIAHSYHGAREFLN